jgi:putative hydrolase of HD superfamily
MKKKDRSELDRLLDFIKLTHRFQQMQRMVRATGEFRWETNAEHAFQLLFTGWYLICTQKIELNLPKVMLYAIVHDVPEVYAGDPCPYTDMPKVLTDKEHRERKARKKLFREFPEFSDFHEILAAYQNLRDPEACFVYGLDKLVPILNIVLDEGKTWKQFNTRLDQVINEKAAKIRLCPICSRLFDLVEQDLRNRQWDLFPNEELFPDMPLEEIVPFPSGRLLLPQFKPFQAK